MINKIIFVTFFILSFAQASQVSVLKQAEIDIFAVSRALLQTASHAQGENLENQGVDLSSLSPFCIQKLHDKLVELQPRLNQSFEILEDFYKDDEENFFNLRKYKGKVHVFLEKFDCLEFHKKQKDSKLCIESLMELNKMMCTNIFE